MSDSESDTGGRRTTKPPRRPSPIKGRKSNVLDTDSSDEERPRVPKSEGQDDGRGKLRQESKGDGDIELPLLRKDRGGKPNETNKPARKEGRRSSKEAPHAPTGALNRDDRSRLFSLLLAPNKGTLYSKERIVQVASVCLLIGCILSFQTCCIYDRVCYDLTGDPAVPRNAANAVIPVAAAVAVFVAPLSLYAVNPQASKGVVFFAGLITVSCAIFFLSVFSRLFAVARTARLTDVVTEAWPTYESRVRNYYGTIDALVERRQALTRHVAIFGLIGFLCEVFTAAALVTMILVPICNESASPWLGCWTR